MIDNNFGSCGLLIVKVLVLLLAIKISSDTVSQSAMEYGSSDISFSKLFMRERDSRCGVTVQTSVEISGWR
ncbi:hypothetical protein L6452_33304 [Arctium lappa]|uniref:Uncharacterized protein n=1 Tax=Arctium lappa TaxID=4217 RepID=A0ACB8Z724_ARCLA|nr:hypothetical protein L6452_33304 [Arctium lappa]